MEDRFYVFDTGDAFPCSRPEWEVADIVSGSDRLVARFNYDDEEGAHMLRDFLEEEASRVGRPNEEADRGGSAAAG